MSTTELSPSTPSVPMHGGTIAPAVTLPGPRALAGDSTAATVRALIESTKPGIVRLVTITAMVGFALGAVLRPWKTWDVLIALFAALLGTALSAAGANAINQYIERGRDALMPRTQRRPLPTARVSPAAVLVLGITLSIIGCGVLLALLPDWSPAFLAAACVVSYIFFYTPLKTRTPWATYVGTIPGALPPLIGWTAASVSSGWDAMLEPAGLSLVAIMLAWQMPHSLALAWMYKDDYAKGGYRLLPVVTPDGVQTAWHVAIWTVLLIPATLAPAYFMPTRLGFAYLALAVVTGAFFVAAAAKFFRVRDRATARKLFIVSVIQLPILFVGMVGEAMVRWAIQ